MNGALWRNASGPLDVDLIKMIMLLQIRMETEIRRQFMRRDLFWQTPAVAYLTERGL